MKRIVLILLLSFAYVAQAQYLAPMNAKNSGSWSVGLLRIDSSFNLRLFDTAVTKLAFPSNLNNRWARQGQRLYIYNGSFFELADNVPAIDTTSLSTRINARVKYTDTASMLVGYVRAARLNDTALAIRSSIPNVSGKVNYTDTAAMLSPYLRKADTTAMLSKYLRKSDTTAMLLPYARKTLVNDTAAAIRASIPNVSGKVNYTDTAAMLSGYVRANRLSDTAAAIRSSIPNVSGKVNYTDTAAMLAPYATNAQVALKLNIVDTANMRIRPIAGSNMTITGTYPNVTFAASGGSTIDTTSLSNRIDARVKYTDTASMLAPYLPSATAAATYVPYTGATTNVNLGEFQASVGQITLDQTPTQTAEVGVLRWNDSDGTADLGLKGGNVSLQIGQEEVVRVVNKSGANLLESQYHAVYVTGAQGQRLKIGNALATSDTTSAATIGLVTENINLNKEGFITTNGLVRNINTTGSLQGETWNDGDLLFLSGTTAGQITNIKPIAPTHTIIIGYVVYAHANNGKIFVKVDNGYELDELHNVRIVSAANNQGLFYDSAAKLWENKSIATVLGYTPANNANVVKYADTSAMLSSYLRKVDTASLSTRIDTKLNSSDTASLSNRINLRVRYIDTAAMLSPYYRTAVATAALATKVNYTDTATMLGGYLRKVDTSTLSNRINLKLNSADTVSLSNRINLKLNSTDTASLSTRIDARVKYSDTATMLSPYYRTATATAALATKVNYTDTAAMLGGYLRKVDTSTLSTRINARVAYADTATMLSPYYRTATATAALALKQNFTDTTSWDATKKNLADSSAAIRGAIPSISGKVNYTDTAAMLGGYLRKVDTSTLSNRINLKLNSSDTASLSNRINAKVGYGTLTTNYVPKATSTTAIGNSQIFDNGTSVGINTATPLAATKLHINSTTNVTLDGGDLRIDNSTNDAASITLNCTGTFGQRYTVFSSAQAFGSQGGFGVYDHTSAFSSLISNGSNELGTLAIRGKSVGGASVSINSSAAGGTTWAIISNATASGRAGMLTFWNGAHRIFFTATGQIGVGAAPNASSILDLTSTTQGLGLPSMTTTQQNAIASPRAGLAVYNSTLNLPTFYNGTAWSPYFSGWSLTGNAGTSDATNFIGTTDGVDVIFRRNNVVSGRLNDSRQTTSFGVGSLPTTSTGDGNTAFGWRALNASTSGGANTALGFWSLRLCTTGFSNSAVGQLSLGSLTTGFSNCAFGEGSGQGVTSGSSNTFYGNGSGNAMTTGTNNIGVGVNAMSTSTAGSKNLVISASGAVPSTTGSDQLNIGNVLWGVNCSGTGTTAAGRLGIGTNAPNASALLDLTSTTQGLLLPRMTTAQINAIGSPAAGLTVYNTDLLLICFFNGTAWQKVTATAM